MAARPQDDETPNEVALLAEADETLLYLFGKLRRKVGDDDAVEKMRRLLKLKYQRLNVQLWARLMDMDMDDAAADLEDGPRPYHGLNMNGRRRRERPQGEQNEEARRGEEHRDEGQQGDERDDQGAEPVEAPREEQPDGPPRSPSRAPIPRRRREQIGCREPTGGREGRQQDAVTLTPANDPRAMSARANRSRSRGR